MARTGAVEITMVDFESDTDHMSTTAHTAWRDPADHDGEEPRALMATTAEGGDLLDSSTVRRVKLEGLQSEGQPSSVKTNTTLNAQGAANHHAADISSACADAPTNIDLTSSVREEDIDPFTYYPPFTKWDYIKITINALWLFPLRLIFVVIPSVIIGTLVCLLAIVCDKYDEDDLQPLNRWGRFVMGYIGPIITRSFLFGFGFNWITTRGKLVPTKEAPILVVSPHSCLLDIFVISLYSKFPTFLARSGVKNIPLLGMLITRTMRTIYVKREDPDSRMKAAEEIRRRTHTRGEWPKVLLFPEGTTTNTKFLISFKQGAFLPKLPVQPVLIKYKNKLNTTTWGEDGLGVIGSLFLTLCQFHNSLEVEFLPVYHPSDEELNNPKLFARNVQVLMAKAFGVPYTNHAFEDVLLMRSARKAGLPFHSGMVVYLKASKDLNMDLRTMKKWLHRFIAMDSDKDGFVKVEDFARFLQVPNDNCVQTVFNSAELKDGKLSFRHYLYGIIGKANPLLQDESFMQSMFNLFDSDHDGVVKATDISSHLPFKSFPHIHNIQSSQQQQLNEEERGDADNIDTLNHDQHRHEGALPEEMNPEQFSSLLAFHPEYVLIFHEQQNDGVNPPSASPPPSTSITNELNLHLQPQSAGTSPTEVKNGLSLSTGHVTQRQADDLSVEAGDCKAVTQQQLHNLPSHGSLPNSNSAVHTVRLMIGK